MKQDLCTTMERLCRKDRSHCMKAAVFVGISGNGLPARESRTSCAGPWKKLELKYLIWMARMSPHTLRHTTAMNLLDSGLI